MTYFQFVAIFLLIPLSWLIWVMRRQVTRQEGGFLLILVIVAVVYTTPWDNYLVATQVWWYDPALVAGIILGWVPLEEYTFFVLQTLLTGLWLYYLIRRYPIAQSALATSLFSLSSAIRWGSTLVAGLVWLGAVIILLIGWRPGTYLALELSWAFLPLMLQLAFGADILWQHRRVILLAILSMTVYLSAADWLAIQIGIWTIDPAQSLNIFLGGYLPIEEAIFFLMTNVLIVFGLILCLAPEAKTRLPAGVRRQLALYLEASG